MVPFSKPDVIIGRNAVKEAIRAGRELDTLLVSKTARHLAPLIEQARCAGAVVKQVDPAKLRPYGQDHQGVVALASAIAYVSVEELLALARKQNQPPFLILCDGIEDPHNLGAIIRTAEAAGAHGLILPKRRSVGMTATVYKSSAGAANVLPVARVANLANTMDFLKAQGVFLYAADMDGVLYTHANLTGAVGLVIGSEGNGVGQLVKKRCDGVVSLPMQGQINSLNASVAGGILMYEVLRQRARAAQVDLH